MLTVQCVWQKFAVVLAGQFLSADLRQLTLLAGRAWSVPPPPMQISARQAVEQVCPTTTAILFPLSHFYLQSDILDFISSLISKSIAKLRTFWHFFP